MSLIDWTKVGIVAAAGILVGGAWPKRHSTLTSAAICAFGLYSLAKGVNGPSTAKLSTKRSAEREKADAAAEAEAIKYQSFKETLVKHLGKGNCDSTSYMGSTQALSNFLKEGLIRAEEFRRGKADKVFYIHKHFAPFLQGGNAVKICVTLNLFCGTVANLGNEYQRNELLQGILDRGELGSFAVTEVAAGVCSGLIIDTTATWTPQGYVLHTPHTGAAKMWISQGLTGRWSVVVARLIVPTGEKKDLGPHAFLIDTFAYRGKGLTVTDMPPKTAFNNLDNAFMEFEQCLVPLDCLLSGVSYVTPQGEYKLVDEKRRFRFEEVMQQILAGRLCISLAGTKLLASTIENLRQYKRLIPTGKNQSMLISDLPILKSLLDEATKIQYVLWTYAEYMVDRFSNAKELNNFLVDQIACAKILNIGFAIDMTMKLKGQIGSYSLQQQSPFGDQTDLLYVFQFAEGDSGILKQKMARDLVTATTKSPVKLLAHAFYAVFGVGVRQRSSAAMLSLLWKMAGKQGDAKTKAWFAAHALVEEVALGHCILTVRTAAKRLGVSPAELAAFDQWFHVKN